MGSPMDRCAAQCEITDASDSGKFIRLKGRIGVADAAGLLDRLRPVATKCGRGGLTVDLSGVDAMDDAASHDPL